MKTHVLRKLPIPAPELEMGQSITAIAAAVEQSGAPIDKGPVSWLSTFPKVAVVQPTTGQLLAISSGMTQIMAKIARKVGHRTLTVLRPQMGRPFNLTVAASKGATNICA